MTKNNLPIIIQHHDGTPRHIFRGVRNTFKDLGREISTHMSVEFIDGSERVYEFLCSMTGDQQNQQLILRCADKEQHIPLRGIADLKTVAA